MTEPQSQLQLGGGVNLRREKYLKLVSSGEILPEDPKD